METCEEDEETMGDVPLVFNLVTLEGERSQIFEGFGVSKAELLGCFS